MKDIMTELDNTVEVLSSKLLDLEEIAYHKNWLYRCVYCGYKVEAKQVPTFEIYKDIIEGHSDKCTLEHWMREITAIDGVKYRFNKLLSDLGINFYFY